MTVKYQDGWVVLVDILGFSNYINEEHDPNKINEMLNFGYKIQYLFENEQDFQVALFSDTLIFTASTIQAFITMLVTLISILFIHMVGQHKLCFRGVAVYGQYFHQNNMAFGPAIIQAAELEKTVVNFARLVMTPPVIKVLRKTSIAISLIKDIDGQTCLNPFMVLALDGIEKKDGNKYKLLISNLQYLRKLILSLINKHKNTSYIVKYFSLIYYYNYTLDGVIQDLSLLLHRVENEEEIRELKLLKIDWLLAVEKNYDQL